MEIAEFLLARVAEDEADARRAQFNNGRWHRTGEWARATSVARDYGPDAVPERVGTLAWDDNGHIARWDPARVLAECEVKRRIVELHRIGGSYTPGDDHAEGFDYCATCGSGEPYEYPTTWPCGTLRLLALPYADHPDYWAEWAPAVTAGR